MAEAPAADRDRCDFAGYLPDLRWVDQERARLFGVIASEHGLFRDCCTWPWVDEALQAASKAILDQHGEERWREFGGVHDANRQPDCAMSSRMAGRVWPRIIAGHGGVLWLDENGTAWAVRVVDEASMPGQCCVFAINSGHVECLAVGAAADQDPVAAAAETIHQSPDRDALRQALTDKAQDLRLYRRASQLLWLIHTLVLEQRSSTVVLPDVMLAQLIWGPDRAERPANWRRDAAAILESLTMLHAATVPSDSHSWQTVLRPEQRLIAAVNQEPAGSGPCPDVCPMHAAGLQHRHINVDIGSQFLGVLELHATQHQADRTRQYNFSGRQQGEAGERLENARRSGQVKTFSVLSRVLGLFDRGILSVQQQTILDGLIGEITRSRSRMRPDHAEIIQGNLVPGPGQGDDSTLVCPALATGQRYVSFNGNGVRRHRGYRLVGEQGRGWLYKCGFAVTEDWAGAGREFLTELAGLATVLELVVAAIDPRTKAWHNLEALQTTIGSRTEWQSVDRLHVRVYGPEDYLVRLRTYLAHEIGFQSIPDVPGVGAVDLLGRMTRLGISKAELAEHVGKSRPYISRLLDGTRPWPDAVLREQCEAFVASRERDAGQGS